MGLQVKLDYLVIQDKMVKMVLLVLLELQEMLDYKVCLVSKDPGPVGQSVCFVLLMIFLILYSVPRDQMVFKAI